MKKVLLIPVLVISLSCNKDNIEEPSKLPLFAGVINDSMQYFEFNPEFELDISWSSCGRGTGIDSLDLNNDNTFDLFLDVTFINGELYSSPDCCPPSMDCFPSFIWYKIRGSKNLEFASYYEIWDDSLYWSYADTIPYGDQIDTITNWEYYTKLWCIDTPVSHGAWYDLNKDMYIGIRLIDSIEFRYGWIRAAGSPDNNIIFKSAYIEK